ncbi:MAG: hypothetical protein IJ899_09990 [Blautia sp.]|nr:hypothetical protein [Blautia sp.]
MDEQNNGANIGTENTTGATQGEKTFTQEQVNAIVGDRVKQERSKYLDYESLKEKAAKFDAAEEANKTELQKATEKADALQKELDALKAEGAVRQIREEVATANGVPASLLSGTTKEDCEAQAKALLEFAGKSGYPQVKDGGTPKNIPSGKETRDQFADWFGKVTK